MPPSGTLVTCPAPTARGACGWRLTNAALLHAPPLLTSLPDLHRAVLTDCRGSDGDCASAAYGDDELRRLSNSPEVLEAVSEDFGGDERILTEAAGGCASHPATRRAQSRRLAAE